MSRKALPFEGPAEATNPRIYVVDDNIEMCRSLEALLTAYDYGVECFTSPCKFLSEKDTRLPGVLIVDLRMAEMSGLELIRQLGEHQKRFPAIMITAHGDVKIAVQAIKAGALDFIQKPFKEDVIIAAISGVTQWLETEGSKVATRERLSERERDVADRLAMGYSNKQIAFELGISVRTVEMHRARAMHRLGCKTFADLLRALLEERG